MATVTQLLDRGSQLTGLAASGTERTLALYSLQDVYNEVVEECDLNETDASFTFDESKRTWSLSTDMSLSDVYRIKHIRRTTTGLGEYLEHVDPSVEMGLAGQGLASGIPRKYAVKNFDEIRFWPIPDSGDAIQITYIAAPPTLVESAPGAGEESTPSKVPELFHWSVLLPGMVVQMLDKDQRSEDASFWQARYEAGKQALKINRRRFGGKTPAIPASGMSIGLPENDRYMRGV